VKQIEADILHILSKIPLPPDDDDVDDVDDVDDDDDDDDDYVDADDVDDDDDDDDVDDRRNDRFIECMNVLNDKLSKATISKDYAMINTIVVSMTNVTKSL